MNSDDLTHLRSDFRFLREAIIDAKSLIRARQFAHEVKFDPGQPRAPEGTSNGGQ